MLLVLALSVSLGEPLCKQDAASALQTVQQFYTEALVEKQVRTAFERHVSQDFVEHKPDIATSDRDGAIKFLNSLIAELPTANWELLRITGDASLVSVHARFTPAKGASSYSIADFFRVENCRIIEHWDVVAPPPQNPVNPLTRF